MKRRALLQSLAALFAARPLARFQLVAETTPITEAEAATLRAIAEVALPSSVDRAGRDRVVAAFVAWVRSYREGADRGHGYGSSTLSAPTGPSPAARYPAQFAALDRAASAHGASSFAALAPEARRAVIEAALNDPQPVQRLPNRPTGANLVADFLGFYFTSGEAWDLAYRAEIGRDRCRTLDGSERAPRAIRASEPRDWRGERGVPQVSASGGFAGTKSPE